MNIINRYDTFCDENHGHHLLPSSASALDAQEQFLNIFYFKLQNIHVRGLNTHFIIKFKGAGLHQNSLEIDFRVVSDRGE